MSRRSHLPVTAPLPRRAILFGAAALAGIAGAAGKPLAQVSIADDARIVRLEALIAALRDAITHELSLEGAAGFRAAQARSEKAELALEAEADVIFSTPAQSLLDLALRARLAEYWNERLSDFLTNQDRAAAELVRAILIMAGLKPQEAPRATIGTIPALINALGGRYALADECGIDASQVVDWERRDCVPPGWHHRFATRARKRGYKLAPDLFG